MSCCQSVLVTLRQNSYTIQEILTADVCLHRNKHPVEWIWFTFVLALGMYNRVTVKSRLNHIGLTKSVLCSCGYKRCQVQQSEYIHKVTTIRCMQSLEVTGTNSNLIAQSGIYWSLRLCRLLLCTRSTRTQWHNLKTLCLRGALCIMRLPVYWCHSIYTYASLKKYVGIQNELNRWFFECFSLR